MSLPTLEQFLTRPSGRRKKLFLKRCVRGPYEQRPRRSQEELSNYLKEKNIQSVRDLLKKRTPGDPMPADYVREFGAWQMAKTAAFGRRFLDDPPPHDPEYLVKVVLQFGLWRYRQYLQARQKRPDIVPSTSWIRVHFGGYCNLRHFAERASFKRTLERYLSLRETLGHWPTVKEREAAGIDLTVAIRHFHGKAALDDYMKALLRIKEKNDVKAV